VTEHDHDAPEEREPKVRVVDKRRYRDGQHAGDARPLQPDAPTPTDEQDELTRAKTQAAEYRDHLQRLQAEFENYR